MRASRFRAPTQSLKWPSAGFRGQGGGLEIGVCVRDGGSIAFSNRLFNFLVPRKENIVVEAGICHSEILEEPGLPMQFRSI